MSLEHLRKTQCENDLCECDPCLCDSCGCSEMIDRKEDEKASPVPSSPSSLSSSLSSPTVTHSESHSSSHCVPTPVTPSTTPSVSLQSQYDMVKTFTSESMQQKLPTIPKSLSIEDILFISKMINSELGELLYTRVSDKKEIVRLLKESVDHGSTDLKDPKPCTDEAELVADQTDAFVDITYYILNTCAKSGLPFDEVFSEVHEANMNKRFPDGSFHRRDDGKVVKPDGWKERDVRGLVRKILSPSSLSPSLPTSLPTS